METRTPAGRDGASSEMGQSAVEAAAEAFAGAAGGDSVFAAGKVKIWACVLLMLHHWICADKSTSTAGTAASGDDDWRVKQVRRRRTARLSSASSPRRVDGAGAAQRRVAHGCIQRTPTGDRARVGHTRAPGRRSRFPSSGARPQGGGPPRRAGMSQPRRMCARSGGTALDVPLECPP